MRISGRHHLQLRSMRGRWLLHANDDEPMVLRRPAVERGLPPIVPNEGTICGTPGLNCFYPPSCIGPETVCMNGAWVWEQIACGG